MGEMRQPASRRLRIVAGATVAAVALATAACNSDSNQPSDEGLVIGLSNFAEDVLDPVLLNGSAARSLLGPLFDSFVEIAPDGSLAPGVLEDWQPSADASSWTFRVRSGIKFHGDWGEATAEDVKFTLERYTIADPPVNSSYSAAINGTIKSVTVVDQMTVRIDLVNPDAAFPAFLSEYIGVPPIMLLPKNYIEQVGDAEFRAHPIGSGPYEFTSHTEGSEVVYTRSDTYWGETPGYKTLTFRLLPEESSRINSIRSGEVDIAEVSADGSIDAEAAGAKLVSIDGGTQVVVQFGQPLQYDGPTSDVRVREALSLAINRQELIDNLLPGGVLPNVPAMLPSAVGFDFEGWQPRADEAYAYDPDRARALLAEAGYANGFEITMLAYELAGASLPPIAQAISDYWRRIGITVNYRPTEFAAVTPWRDAEPNAPELLGQAYTHRYFINPNPVTYFKFIYDVRRLFRELNNAPYTTSDPEVQQILDRIDGVIDDAQRTALLDELTERTYKLYLAVPVAQLPTVYAVAPDVDWDPGLNPFVGSSIASARPAR